MNDPSAHRPPLSPRGVPGRAVSGSVSIEGTYTAETLQDPDPPGAEHHAPGRARGGPERAHQVEPLAPQGRSRLQDLGYLLLNVPSFVPFQALSLGPVHDTPQYLRRRRRGLLLREPAPHVGRHCRRRDACDVPREAACRASRTICRPTRYPRRRRSSSARMASMTCCPRASGAAGLRRQGHRDAKLPVLRHGARRAHRLRQQHHPPRAHQQRPAAGIDARCSTTPGSSGSTSRSRYVSRKGPNRSSKTGAIHMRHIRLFILTLSALALGERVRGARHRRRRWWHGHWRQQWRRQPGRRQQWWRQSGRRQPGWRQQGGGNQVAATRVAATRVAATRVAATKVAATRVAATRVAAAQGGGNQGAATRVVVATVAVAPQSASPRQ